MIRQIQKWIFGLYERPRLRNWFYTLAFAIFVPTGFRFAILAWNFGAWFDRPLAVLAGTIIGLTAVVTLLRIWKVPPQQTLSLAPDAAQEAAPAKLESVESDLHLAVMRQAARNRQIARDARSLGSTRV